MDFAFEFGFEKVGAICIWIWIPRHDTNKGDDIPTYTPRHLQTNTGFRIGARTHLFHTAT